MGLGAALTVFVLFISCVDAESGGVTFWRTKFTMTCPGETDEWYLNDELITSVNNKTHETEYDNSKKGIYHCIYGSDKTKYYFYVQGKVCENCFELNADVFFYAMAVDMIFTVGVMFIIYNCTKKKNSDESSPASNAPARSGGRAPPIPHPDYEPLNPHTQNLDPYSRLG